MSRVLTFAILLTIAACGSTEPKSFRIIVSGPDALVGSRRLSPSGYDAIVDCTWSVIISAEGGQPGDVAQITGSRLEVVAPGFRTTDEFDATATTNTLGTDHLATGETLAPPPWTAGTFVPASSGTYLSFTGTITYRFRMPSGRVEESAHALACN